MSPPTTWGETAGINWDNADESTKAVFALTRLYWYHRMIACGGPDGSELDGEVSREAREAADWFGPILYERAKEANRG